MKRFYVFSGNIVPLADGPYGLVAEAQAEIDSRDKRLINLAVENREVQHKVGHLSKRIAELEAEARELRRVIFEAKHGKRPA